MPIAKSFLPWIGRKEYLIDTIKISWNWLKLLQRIILFDNESSMSYQFLLITTFLTAVSSILVYNYEVPIGESKKFETMVASEHDSFK
jgi:hypothetical protein